MPRVVVIFTEHEERGALTAAALLDILERLGPEVIFLECPPEALSSYLQGKHASLEPSAVNQYCIGKRVDLVPVDDPTPDPEFFTNLRALLGDNAITGPEYDYIASQHRQYVNHYGLAYLNSDYCTDLHSRQQALMRNALAKVANSERTEAFQGWVSTIGQRDANMIARIEDYCRRSAFDIAVLLVGAGHRRSISERTFGVTTEAASIVAWQALTIPSQAGR